MLKLIHRYATGRNTLMFLLADLAFMFGVMPYAAKKIDAISPGAKVLDLEIPTYTAEKAHAMIAAFTPEGLALYRTIELSLDLIYPLIYGLAYALIIAFLWKKTAPASGISWWLPLVPLIGVIFDISENISIVSLIDHLPAQPDNIAVTGGYMTLFKWIFAFAGMGLMLIGLIGWGISAIAKKK